MSLTLECRDAFVALTALEASSVDLSLFDPPYESLERHRLHPDGRARGKNPRLTSWFDVIKNESLGDLMKLIYRAQAKNSHCYVISDAETLFHLKPAGEAAGFKFWKPIVWDKMRIGMGYHYRAQVEFISFFEKGKRNLFDRGVPDVLSCPRVQQKRKCECEPELQPETVIEIDEEGHVFESQVVVEEWRKCVVCKKSLGSYPTEKPLSLLEVLVLQSTKEHERVLDCFMGSGATGEAAILNGRRFHGIDNSPRSYELAKKRLTGLNRAPF